MGNKLNLFRAACLLLLALAAEQVCGQTVPDIIISEFVANPADPLETEWIELHNTTGTTIDLSLVQIGDRLGLRRISETERFLGPEGYLILAQDTTRFRDFYGAISCQLITSEGWQSLNNDGDLIRLANLGGTVFDSVEYAEGFSLNRSWERFVDGAGNSYWGQSFAPSGSTPCAPNSFYYPPPEAIVVRITPNPFSPDNDGFEDQTIIEYDVPIGGSMMMRLYDIAGRVVRDFADGTASIPGEITWDGRDDNGERLPIGIYILYVKVETDRTYEDKSTVVLAR